MRKRSEVQVVPMVERHEAQESNVATVEEISTQLERELHAGRFEFESNNRRPPSAPRDDLKRIVEEVFVDDLHGAWARLKKKLKAESRSDHATLHKATEEAADDAYEAHRLFVTARVLRAEWERENEATFGGMWSEANRSLQREKDDKQRAKQITDADVRSRCATLFPDEWRSQEGLRDRYKATEESLSQLAEIYLWRMQTSTALLKKLR
jgi:hypothetical protein